MTRVRVVVAVGLVALAAGCGGAAKAGPSGQVTPQATASATSPAPTLTISHTPRRTKSRATKTPAASRRVTATPPAVTSGGAMSAVELKVLNLTNAQRAQHGCGPLRADTRLANAARAHSRDMAVHHYFAHNSQDGTTPWTRIMQAGYADPGAENIAAGYPTALAVMTAWMNSPGHRANILNCGLKALGVGVYYGGSISPYWTQDFGWT